MIKLRKDICSILKIKKCKAFRIDNFGVYKNIRILPWWFNSFGDNFFTISSGFTSMEKIIKINTKVEIFI